MFEFGGELCVEWIGFEMGCLDGVVFGGGEVDGDVCFGVCVCDGCGVGFGEVGVGWGD